MYIVFVYMWMNGISSLLRPKSVTAKAATAATVPTPLAAAAALVFVQGSRASSRGKRL